MAQTDEMKRLRWNGELVGYERKRISNTGRIITEQTEQSVDGDDWFLLKEGKNYIIYNSLEIGIRLDDGTLVFEGDRCKDKKGSFSGIAIGDYGTVKSDKKLMAWIIRWDDGSFDYLNDCEIIIIGSIHDEVKK